MCLRRDDDVVLRTIFVVTPKLKPERAETTNHTAGIDSFHGPAEL